MKLPKCAIPLYVPKGQTTYVGTGFLVRRGDEVGLMTAASMPIGIQPFATAGWVGWPHEVLAAPDPTGEPIAVQMFAPGEGPRSPAFSYAFRNESTGWMRDMIGLFDPINAPAFTALEEVFDVVDLDGDPLEPAKGAVVTALGYPDRGGASMWPYESPRKATGPFERVADDGLLEAVFAVNGGYAGAPAFTDKGELVGMVTGTPGDSARIHSRADLHSL